jgi:CHASE3 domain sensor protein
LDNVIKYLLVIIIFIIFIIIGGISYFIISNYENDKSPSEQVEQKITTQDDIKKSVQQRQGRIEEIKKVGRDLGGN